MKSKQLLVSKGCSWLVAAVVIVSGACTASPPPEEVDTRTGAVIFNDNWKSLREFPTDLAIWKYADATAILTSGVSACESFSTASHCFLNAVRISNDESVNVCSDEPFGTNLSLSRPEEANGRRGICTAFLVGDDLMLTAGHCLQADDSHDQIPGTDQEVPHCTNETEVIFGFNQLTGNNIGGGTVTSIIRRNDVFGCSEVLARTMTEEADFTLFRTNRPVIGHHRFRIRRSGTAPVGTDLVALGHSLGLPLKVDELGRLQVTDSSCSSSNLANCRLQGRYTSFGGGSGMPVINKDNGRIEGIHNAGPQPSMRLTGVEDDGTPCNELASCGASGCNTSTFSLPWSVATDVKAVDDDLIPEPPGPGVRIVANFDEDILLDDLSVTPQNGTFHLRINWGDDSKPAYDRDTGFAESALPPGLDLAFTLTVRDFDNDNIEDFVSQFAGFAPLYIKGGSTLAPPAVTPFGALISYGGFTVGDYNGDNFADLVGQNQGNGQVARFYGSEAGLVRAIRIPDECLNDPSVRLPDRRPRALAILPIGTFGNINPVAAFDCPGSTNSARLMFFDLLTEQVVSRPSLAMGGNWRALAYRRDRFDMLGLAEMDDDFGYEIFRLSPALGGGVDIEPVFSQLLASNERPVGITWNESAQELRILIEIGGSGADGLGARLISLQESGADGAAPVTFNNCLRTLEDIRPQESAGVVQGAGVATVGCTRDSALGVSAHTALLEIANGGGVSEASIYLVGDSFLREEALQDLECDPLGGLLWGMSQSGRFVLVKPTSFTACPSIFNVSFNQLPPLNNGEWHTNGTALPVTPEGALRVDATSASTVAGPLFAASAQRAIGTNVDLDVFVPLAPAAPAWAGAVQLTMSTPAAMNQFVGQVELTPLSRGQWHPVSFTLSSSQQEALARGDRDVQFSISVNRPTSPNPLLLRNLRFSGTLTVRDTIPIEDPYASAPVLGFEDTAAWSSPQATLARETSRVTQGAAALRVTAQGYSEVNSRTFRTQGLAPTATLGLDVFVPTQQPNPYWFGDVNGFVSCPSAGINNAYLGNRALTGLTTGVFHTLDFSLPGNVVAALESPRSDCTLKLALNVPSGAGAYVFDNLRFR